MISKTPGLEAARSILPGLQPAMKSAKSSADPASMLRDGTFYQDRKTIRGRTRNTVAA